MYVQNTVWYLVELSTGHINNFRPLCVHAILIEQGPSGVCTNNAEFEIIMRRVTAETRRRAAPCHYIFNRY